MPEPDEDEGVRSLLGVVSAAFIVVGLFLAVMSYFDEGTTRSMVLDILGIGCLGVLGLCVSYDLENDKIPTSEDLLRNACLDAATGRGVGTRAAADSNRTAPVDRCLGLRLLSARRPRIVLHRDGDGPGGSAGRFHRASSDQTRLVKKAAAEGSASCCLIRWTPSTEKTC